MSVMNALPYRVLRTLSQGPLAEVHEAIGPKGPAILKVARAEAGGFGAGTGPAHATQGLAFVTGGVSFADPDPGAVLAAEAKVLAGIDHPAFPRVLAQGEAAIDGVSRRWMLIELISGQTWRAALEGATKPTPAKLLALAQVLADVKAQGQLGWHGDLKPENVMIDAAGKPRLIDPTSGAAQEDATGLPAQLLLTETYNPAYAMSDLPALGMMLLELLLGAHPLADGAESPPPGRVIGPGLERWLAGKQVVGQLRMARRLACLSLPAGADPRVEACGLRALGLARTGATLDLAPAPYADVAAFAADLGQALG